MKATTKRFGIFLITLCLVIGLIPFEIFAKDTDENTVEFLSQQLILGDNLTMNFVLGMDEMTAKSAVVKLEAGENIVSYFVAAMKPNAEGNYAFSIDVAAAQMTEEILVTATVNNAVIAERTYSVRQYADAILSGNYTRQAKALVKEMLNYGAKAQNYFDYCLENLANEGLEEISPAQIPSEVPEIQVDGKVDGITYYGSSVLFTGKLTLRYYFNAPNGVQNYTFCANGVDHKAENKNGLYYIDVVGINPQDIDKPVVLTVSDINSILSIDYGPMHYITRMWHSDGREPLKGLLQALYGYHIAAKNYVENGELETTYPAVVPNYELNREKNQHEIMAFWTPPVNEQQYIWMKENGITAICLDNKYDAISEHLDTVLTICDRLDIDVYLSIGRESASGGEVIGRSHYFTHTSFKGFYVDEPITKSHIQNIANMYRETQKAGLHLVVNILGGYSTNPKDYSWIFDSTEEFQDAIAAGEFFANYDGYLAYFKDVMGSTEKLTLCTTSYPLLDRSKEGWSNTVDSAWLINLQAAKNHAAYFGTDVWQCLQTTAYHNGGNTNYHRQPSEADIRWQYYTAMAYGVTGFVDFVYTTVGEGSEFNKNDHGSIWWTDINDYSTYYRTDVYYSTQAVHHEIAMFDHVLCSYEWQGVMTNITDSGSSAGKALKNAPQTISSHYRINNLSSTRNLLVGCFRDTNNYDGFLLVNFDDTVSSWFTYTNTINISFDKAQTAVIYTKGERQIVTLEKGVYTCNLKPGEGVFVIPIEGDEQQTIDELPIPDGAQMVADFTSCESYQGISGVLALDNGSYIEAKLESYHSDINNQFVFRMKAEKDAVVTVGGYTLSIPNTDWNDIAIPRSCLQNEEIVVKGKVWIDQIFAVRACLEEPIPNGTVLVTDYSVAGSPWNNPNWGHGTIGIAGWHQEYDGVAGVQAFGVQNVGIDTYTMWTAITPGFDFSGYTYVTLRLKASDAVRAIWFGDGGSMYDFTSQIPARNEWTTVTLKVSDIPIFYLCLSSFAGTEGEMVWIDQIWVSNTQPEETEPEVTEPEETEPSQGGDVVPGDTQIVRDYSVDPVPWNNPNWGGGAVGITKWYTEFEGVEGVQAFGMNYSGSTYTMWTNVLPLDYDYGSYTYLSIRLKINKDTCRALYFGDGNNNYNFIDQISVSNEWTTVTLKISDIPFVYLLMSNSPGGTGEMVWIDQVWVH